MQKKGFSLSDFVYVKIPVMYMIKLEQLYVKSHIVDRIFQFHICVFFSS